MTPAVSPDAFAPLAAESSTPLYRQLYARVRASIAAGDLAPGDRVPSARALAKELGVARGTIELAYELLTSEGYMLARGQAGTVIHPALRPAGAAAPAAVAPPETPAPSTQDALWRPAQLLPFQLGVPAMDAFPRKLLARLGARYLRGMHLVLRLPGERSDRPLAEKLLAHGMAVQPMSGWWASERRDSALLLSFTNSTAALMVRSSQE